MNAIELAKQAGFHSAEFWPDDFKGLYGSVQRLLALHRTALIEELSQGAGEPSGWRMTSTTVDYGVTCYDREQMETSVEQGWVVISEIFTREQVAQAACQAIVGMEEGQRSLLKRCKELERAMPVTAGGGFPGDHNGTLHNRITALEQANRKLLEGLTVIAAMPIPEQDNMISRSMRDVACALIAKHGGVK
ncbi:MAG: hypothetical protein KGL39_35995 [Patescibacteria group bacterium]|nr:hypothetical protein [Patescibacteria group bacterium]